MKCPKCSFECPPVAKYCSQCGTQVLVIPRSTNEIKAQIETLIRLAESKKDPRFFAFFVWPALVALWWSMGRDCNPSEVFKEINKNMKE